MAWFRREAHLDAAQDQERGMTEDEEVVRQVVEAVKYLRVMVGQVTPEEFRWQEANYDRNSLLGRELLYLVANNEWIRATAEMVDIVRADAIETKIKVDIDLDRITHEAFHQRDGHLWLPVVVLPPLKRPGLPEPDPFVTLTVTDAAGNLLATLPNADVRHRIAAAMAEIIINMAVAWWPDKSSAPSATRDQRLLLSAAIYQLLRRDRAVLPSQDAEDVYVSSEDVKDETAASSENTEEMTAPLEDAKEETTSDALPRMSYARRELLRLVKVYSALLERTYPDRADVPANTEEKSAEASGTVEHGASGIPFVRRLTERAVLVLNALRMSTIVVVAADRHDTPTVLTVQVPSRDLHEKPNERKVLRPATWIKPGTWNWVLPRAELEVDLLLPSSDADRQVEANLPAGVSFDPSRPRIKQAEMEITVRQPPLLRHLQQLILQLRDAPDDWPVPLYQCLTDLTGVKAEAARALLRDHSVSPLDKAYPAVGKLQAQPSEFHEKLDQLRAELGQFSIEGDCAKARTRIKEIWGNGKWLESVRLQRYASADPLSARAVLARAGLIEDISKRASPDEAKLHVHVAVADADSFYIARFSGWMSVLLMVVVVTLLLLSERLFKISYKDVSAEVLAIVLTLFSAIQAGRIERSDRSTVRGRLVVRGNRLIVASILPAVVLAVALAFSRTVKWSVAWAIGCISFQLVVQGGLWLRLKRAERAGPERAASSPPRTGLVLTTDRPDYSHSEALQSSWWRNTTADALTLGRQAYGYVIWQRRTSPTLRELLEAARPAQPSATTSTLERNRWFRRLANLGAAWRRIQPADDLPLGQPGLSTSRGNGVGTGEASSLVIQDFLGERPANVLALQRSGTADQALTFAVFREQPEADWVTRPVVFPVDLNPDRLAPAESMSGTIEIFLGLPEDHELLTVSSHPITTALATVADHRLSVLEVQLPVPPPVSAYQNYHWARVLVALRDFEITQISDFLNSVRQLTYSTREPGPKTNSSNPFWITGIKTTPETPARIINPPKILRRDATGLILASNMDVTSCCRSHSGRSGNANTWRVLAICADSRNGIENYILDKLGNEHQEPEKELRLAGLTYVLLHGKAVMLLVGYQRGDPTSRDDLQSSLRNDPKGASIKVCVDERQSRKDLGHAGLEPLLRVHIRTPDRRGATLDALDSLRETLQATAAGSDSIQTNDWNVWYARIEVAAGNAGNILLTLRLSVDESVVKGWTPEKLEEIERRVRQRAASKAARAVGALSDSPSPQEDTDISVKPITWPTARVRYGIRNLDENDSGSLDLVLWPDRPAWLPALELRGRDDNRPVGREDPLLLRVPAGPVEQELAVRIPLGEQHLPRFCRLFVADKADAKSLHIADPWVKNFGN